MKKRVIIDLIKSHMTNNELAFKTACTQVAESFYESGDTELAQYIQGLINETDLTVQSIKSNNTEFEFLTKIPLKNVRPIPLPTEVSKDIQGIMNCINKNFKMNKFLFYGKPGSGKTETVKNIAKMLNYPLYKVDQEQLIDSKLGQTSKNIIKVFQEISMLKSESKSIVLFDEIDALILNRSSSNDLREMARATSTFFSQLEEVSDDVIIFATTNLYQDLDKALIRRFDSKISFDKYTNDDLIDIGKTIGDYYVTQAGLAKDTKLLKKVLSVNKDLPYPAELQNIIKSSIAFSNPEDEYDYLKRLLANLYKPDYSPEELVSLGFSTREAANLTGFSKSSVSRLASIDKNKD